MVGGARIVEARSFEINIKRAGAGLPFLEFGLSEKYCSGLKEPNKVERSKSKESPEITERNRDGFRRHDALEMGAVCRAWK